MKLDEDERRIYGSHELKRGFWGIGLWQPKFNGNVGGVMRGAHCFGADFVMVMGDRYRPDRLDVTNASHHIPVFEFKERDEFFAHIPKNCVTVGIEITADSDSLVNFCHPKQALYVLGPEDGSLPKAVLEQCDHIIRIPTLGCLNVNVAAGVVMYDRLSKQKKQATQHVTSKGDENG